MSIQTELKKKGLRRCTACKCIKPLSEFYFKSQRNGYYFSRCKDCTKEIRHTGQYRSYQREYHRNWRKRNNERYRNYQREWHRNWREQNRERHLNYKRNYQHNWSGQNPEYIKFIKYAETHFPMDPECLLCNSAENLHRHHPKYFGFNIEFAWIFCTLCTNCHPMEDEHKDEWTVQEIETRQ